MGANFRDFRDWLSSHKIFHQRWNRIFLLLTKQVSVIDDYSEGGEKIVTIHICDVK